MKNAKKVNNKNNAVIKNPSNLERTSTSSLNPGKTGVNNRGEIVRTKEGLPLQLLPAEGETERERDEVHGRAEGRTEERKVGEAWSLATVDKNRKIETSSEAKK